MRGDATKRQVAFLEQLGNFHFKVWRDKSRITLNETVVKSREMVAEMNSRRRLSTNTHSNIGFNSYPERKETHFNPATLDCGAGVGVAGVSSVMDYLRHEFDEVRSTWCL